jgi:hypothetical protein
MSTTKVDNEHEQLVSMLNQLLDEREILSRENEYLKAKLNQSALMETIKEMKKERDLLFKLLSNLTINNDEQIKFLKHSNKDNNPSTPSRHNPSLTMNHARVHRLKPNIEQQPSTVGYSMKHFQSNKKIFLYKTEETNRSIRKSDIKLKHSQHSPFQHYRSQSLEDLT